MLVPEITFWEIQWIQIKIYPQISIGPKYGAFYSNNKVRAHTLNFVNLTSSTKMYSSFLLNKEREIFLLLFKAEKTFLKAPSVKNLPTPFHSRNKQILNLSF